MPRDPVGISTVLCTMLIVAAASLSAAQGTATSTLSGVVVDSSGAVIPGADVTIRNNATGATFTTVSAEQGAFTVPALAAGTYSVTVSLTGFKQVVVSDVRLHAATPSNVRVVLDVGSLEETVMVKAGAEILQTQSSAVSTTMEVTQISNLPLVTRNALNFITFLPGVATAGMGRGSTINGLPQGAINITIDGVNVQDNFGKTGDGFFAAITPRLDAIEEVTVTGAAQGAESAGQGAAQISFVTRSGTNRLAGSVYHYYRDPRLNSNYWFNNRDLPPDPATGKAPKDQVKVNQYGFRMGGPIVLPKLFDGHNKAFFFFNYEEFRQPNESTRTRTILTPQTERGLFQYNVNVGGQTQVREVDLLALAARSGQTSTLDPIVGRVLADIRAATGSTGGLQQLTDPNLQRYTFTNSGDVHNYYPTVRLDVNLSDRHRLSGSWSYQRLASSPDFLNSADPTFPGFPNIGGQSSHRNSISMAWRSTLSTNMVNELRVGGSGATLQFRPEVTAAQFGGTDVGDQGGFAFGTSPTSGTTGFGPAGLSNPVSGISPSSRNAPSYVVENTLNWNRGSHSLRLGGSFTQVSFWNENQTVVPSLTFGVDSNDPALGMFTTANFPGAANADLTRAQNIYAVLTGRITSISANAQLDEETNQYAYLGPRVQRGRMRELGFFAQDSWRLRKNLTVNYGLRWELQLPFVPLNDSYTTATVDDLFGVSGPGNVFRPGVLEGQPTQFIQYREGDRAYNVDYNNFAPNLGFAWRPTSEKGWLNRLLGGDDGTVVRGGYALAYNRNGMSDFSGVFGNNPGSQITATRSMALGNLVTSGSLPVLLRQAERLGPPAFAATPEYPLTGAVTNSVNVFDPNIQVPYAQSWTFGIQRAITANTALEVRYVGTRHLQGWTDYDFNEATVVENGFLDEFRLAQANLQANIAAGRGNTFRYAGPGTGTSPLPIMLAHFSGIPTSRAGDSSVYTSAQFGTATFLNPLALNNPNPAPNPTDPTSTTSTASFARNLYADAGRRANALAAGLPPNFFLANPDLQGGAFMTGNGGYTRYDSLQLELRRRMSRGLLVQANYVFAKAFDSARFSLRAPRVQNLQDGDEGGVQHAFKVNWVYELPIGRERRFFSGAGPVLDRIIGGWHFDGAARIQSGRIMSFGNVRLVGFTRDELQDMYKLRFDDAGRVIYILPQDVIDNTIKAFSVSATSPTGYGALGAPTGRYFAPANGPDCIQVVTGDCAPPNVFVTGPMFARLDLSVVKRVPVTGRVNVEFRADFLNALNNINFIPVATASNSPTMGQVTAAYRDASGTQDPGGRLVQLVSRISW